jgi:small neutral amino acid transporter SnatA (MarC family)
VKGNLLEAAGVIAVVYGIGNYLVANLNWTEYSAWIAGGVILLLIGWAKRAMEK